MWLWCFVSPTISYLLLQSKTVVTDYPSLCVFFSSILYSAFLLNAMHIGDCYRDFPLRPVYCCNPLVSRSRQTLRKLDMGCGQGVEEFKDDINKEYNNNGQHTRTSDLHRQSDLVTCLSSTNMHPEVRQGRQDPQWNLWYQNEPYFPLFKTGTVQPTCLKKEKTGKNFFQKKPSPGKFLFSPLSNMSKIFTPFSDMSELETEVSHLFAP